MLTAATNKPNLTPYKYIGGEGYMKGSYHYHAPAKRFYVSIYWDAAAHKIWRYNGEPIWHQKTAEKLLGKIRAEIDDGRFILASYLPDSPLSLKGFAEGWLAAFSGAESTRKFYRKCIGKSIEHFGEDFDIRNFTHSKLKIFYNALPYSTRGRYHYLSTLKNLLKFAEKDGILTVPPFPELPEGLKQEIRYLSFDQQQQVLSCIPPPHRDVFLFAMEYGLRIGEVCALQKDCITPDQIIVRRTVSEGELRQTTKTGRVRRHGITTTARAILDRQPKRLSPYVFTRDESGKPYTWKSMTKRWRTACKKAGITINLYNAIRHSLGCQLMDQGVELEAVRDILGHTSTNMTRRYAQRSVDRLTNILEFRGVKEAPAKVKNVTN